MELDRAVALAEFINTQNSRFHAGVLEFGLRGWVIVVDRQTQKNLEPIADPEDYLRRANHGILLLDPLYRDLISLWLTRMSVEAEKMAGVGS